MQAGSLSILKSLLRHITHIHALHLFHTNVHMHVYLCNTRIYVCRTVCVYVCVCVCVYMCVRVCVYVRACVCNSMYIPTKLNKPSSQVKVISRMKHEYTITYLYKMIKEQQSSIVDGRCNLIH